MMLLALTVERYVSVCRPGQHTRPLCGPPHLTVALIPLATFLVYLPNVFREEVATCLLALGGPVIYQKRENHFYLDSLFYQVIKTFCYFELRKSWRKMRQIHFSIFIIILQYIIKVLIWTRYKWIYHSSTRSQFLSEFKNFRLFHRLFFHVGVQSGIGNRFQSSTDDTFGWFQSSNNGGLSAILRTSSTDDTVQDDEQRWRFENVRGRKKARASFREYQHPVPRLR